MEIPNTRYAGTDTLKEMTLGSQRTSSLNTSSLLTMSAKGTHDEQREDKDAVTSTIPLQGQRSSTKCNRAQHDDE